MPLFKPRTHGLTYGSPVALSHLYFPMGLVALSNLCFSRVPGHFVLSLVSRVQLPINLVAHCPGHTEYPLMSRLPGPLVSSLVHLSFRLPRLTSCSTGVRPHDLTSVGDSERLAKSLVPSCICFWQDVPGVERHSEHET